MNVLLVGIGGAMGAIARYLLGGWVFHHTAQSKFPFGTFAVNVAGCLLAGILFGLAEKQDFFTPLIRLFLFTGFLGGFTTFSAFGIETVFLIESHEVMIALLYSVGSLAAGLGAVWLGVKVIPHSF